MSNNNDLTVGRVYSTTMNQPSGITEVLLEKAQREIEEQARLLGMGSEREARLITERDEARAMLERKWHEEDPPLIKMMRERNHYKEALEEISTTIQEYKDSIIQEPSEDFIWAIKAWADKKLKENI